MYINYCYTYKCWYCSQRQTTSLGQVTHLRRLCWQSEHLTWTWLWASCQRWDPASVNWRRSWRAHGENAARVRNSTPSCSLTYTRYQITSPLCQKVNSAFYPLWDGKMSIDFWAE